MEYHVEMSYKTLGLGFVFSSFFFFIIYEAQLLARFRHLDSSKILPFHWLAGGTFLSVFRGGKKKQ